MDKHILKIKGLIGSSKIEEVFEQLDRIQGLNETESDTLISLKSQYSDFNRQVQRGSHRDGQRVQELSALTSRLLDFTNVLLAKKDTLSLSIKKADLLKSIRESKLDDIFNQLSYLKLENRTHLGTGIVAEYNSIKISFGEYKEHLEIYDLSNERYGAMVADIKDRLKMFITNLGNDIFEPAFKQEDNKEAGLSKPKVDREKYLKDIYLRMIEFFNRRKKDSIYTHIRRDMFLGDKYVTFDELVSKFIAVNGPNIKQIDTHLDAPWNKFFIDEHKKFFNQIKKSLSKKYFDCVIFNSLIKAIESDETLIDLDEEQKILGILVIISGLVSHVENQCPGTNDNTRREFILMSNRIIGRVFKNPNLTLADFKHIMTDKKPQHPNIVQELEQLKETINEKLGGLKNIIKIVYKIFDDSFISKKSKNKIDVADLSCLVNQTNGGFFRPKSKHFFSLRLKKSEDTFLLGFHIFVLNIKGNVASPDKNNNSKPKIDFLIEASHNNQFKYRKTSLLMGLSQFWLLPVKEPFLGNWPH